MTESMRKFMKVGIIQFMAYPATDDKSILDSIRKIAVDDYFDAIEITHIKNPETRKQVKKMLEASHMTVAFGSSPCLLTEGRNVNNTNEKERQRAVQVLKEKIDEAYEMNAVGFSFLSGKYDASKKEEAFKAHVESTHELCEYAKSNGNIRIILEVFDYDIDKKSLIGPAELAKRYAEEITKSHDNFGLMVDLSHIPLLRETVEESILPIKDYIVHAHMGNCVVKDPSLPAYGDMHPRFGFPNGENDVNELVEYLRVLKKIGFLNEKNPPIVSFEVKPYGDEDPDIIVANSKRVLNAAWLQV